MGTLVKFLPSLCIQSTQFRWRWGRDWQTLGPHLHQQIRLVLNCFLNSLQSFSQILQSLLVLITLFTQIYSNRFEARVHQLFVSPPKRHLRSRRVLTISFSFCELCVTVPITYLIAAAMASTDDPSATNASEVLFAHQRKQFSHVPRHRHNTFQSTWQPFNMQSISLLAFRNRIGISGAGGLASTSPGSVPSFSFPGSFVSLFAGRSAIRKLCTLFGSLQNKFYPVGSATLLRCKNQQPHLFCHPQGNKRNTKLFATNSHSQFGARFP